MSPATSRSVLVLYDCTARSDATLALAVEHCLGTRGRLGIAIAPPWYAGVALPWATNFCAQPGAELCKEVLKRIPDEIPVKFLVRSWCPGTREIPELARRLECDAVLLSAGGARLRRAQRVLSRRGIHVLNGDAASFQQPPPGRPLPVVIVPTA